MEEKIVTTEQQPAERSTYRGRDKSRSASGKDGSRGFRPKGSRKDFIFKKKVCFFCKNKEAVLDYKDVNLMRKFIAESCKISPRRFTGTCAKHQRALVREIKKARQMALIPYVEK